LSNNNDVARHGMGVASGSPERRQEEGQ